MDSSHKDPYSCMITSHSVLFTNEKSFRQKL